MAEWWQTAAPAKKQMGTATCNICGSATFNSLSVSGSFASVGVSLVNASFNGVFMSFGLENLTVYIDYTSVGMMRKTFTTVSTNVNGVIVNISGTTKNSNIANNGNEVIQAEEDVVGTNIGAVDTNTNGLETH